MPSALPIQKLTDEQAKLIEDNMDFIRWCFKRFNVNNEDWQQDCLYGICKFIHLYDPERGSIASFLREVILSRICTIYKRDNTKKENLNTYAVRFEDTAYEDSDGDTLTYYDVVGSEDESFDKIGDRDLYYKFLEDLCNDKRITKKQFNNFVAYINLGDYEQVGKLYGYSRQAAYDAAERVRKKIKHKNSRKILLGE